MELWLPGVHNNGGHTPEGTPANIQRHAFRIQLTKDINVQMEDPGFDIQVPFVAPIATPVTTLDVDRMREELQPAAIAWDRGTLAYLPTGIFWQPKWYLDEQWPTTAVFKEHNFSPHWFSPKHVEILLPRKDASSPIRMYSKGTSARMFLVTVRDPSLLQGRHIRDEDVDHIVDVLMVQCRNSRHGGAMLTVADFYRNNKPWDKPDSKHRTKVDYVLNFRGGTSCARCRVTAGTLTSGHAKKRKAAKAEAEQLLLQHSLQRLSPPPAEATTSQSIVPPHTSIDHETINPTVQKVVKVFDAGVGTPCVGNGLSPGDEVFRHMVVGNDKLVRKGIMPFKGEEYVDYARKAFEDLKDFGTSKDERWWKKVSTETGINRYEVSI